MGKHLSSDRTDDNIQPSTEIKWKRILIRFLFHLLPLVDDVSMHWFLPFARNQITDEIKLYV